MNILQIVHCFPPESMTGSEIYAYNLSRGLLKRHNVSVFYRINNSNYKEYEILKNNYNGLDVYKINNTLKDCKSIAAIYKNEKIENKFVQVLKEVKPDIVHIHHLLFLSLGVIDEIKKRDIPIIFTLHDYWLTCPRGQLFKSDLSICRDPLSANCLYCLAAGLNLRNLFKKIGGFLAQRKISKNYLSDSVSRLRRLTESDRSNFNKICQDVDLFIAPSNFLRNRFIDFGLPAEKIIYSDNGMDLSLFKDIEKRKSDKIRFGFIGTLIPSKGVHVLIKAFNKINDSRAVLKIYGKAPLNNGVFDYYHKIRRLARNNKNIRFMGTFDNKDIARIFKEIDVLIFPSLWQENAPLVLREAILAKTPVIASDVGGVSEVVKDGIHGFLFNSGDIQGLYTKIRYLIDNPTLLKNFKQDIPAIKTIGEDSKEFETIYENLKR
jgi:glycosyltransferase involved in cell wall biosynthesis